MRVDPYRREKVNFRIEEFVEARRDWTLIAFSEGGQPYLSRCREPECDAIAEVYLVFDYTEGSDVPRGTEKRPFCREHAEKVVEGKIHGGKGVYVR